MSRFPWPYVLVMGLVMFCVSAYIPDEVGALGGIALIVLACLKDGKGRDVNDEEKEQIAHAMEEIVQGIRSGTIDPRYFEAQKGRLILNYAVNSGKKEQPHERL